MFWYECGSCDASVIGIGNEARDSGWLKDTQRNWWCPACQINAYAAGNWTCADCGDWKTCEPGCRPVPRVKPAVAQGKPDVLSTFVADRTPTTKEEPRGFNRPEDGSQPRYAARRKSTPWTTHTLYWVIHNCVAHPLIGVLPLKPFFQFHDWTSHKMHGSK